MGKQSNCVKNVFLLGCSLATCDDWTSMFEIVKVQCSHVAISLIKELEQQFPNQELMNTTCIIYP
jgi:hypothetical protein